MPRFVAALTAGSLVSTSVLPAALAADPPASAAPAKPPVKVEAKTEVKADAKVDAKAPTTTTTAAPAAKPTATATTPAAKPATPAKPLDKKTRDAARKAYTEGEKAFAAGDYVAAYAGFSKANELIPSPQARYWMAKSIDAQGKTTEAISAYEALIVDPEASALAADKLEDARARVEALKATLPGEVVLTTVPAGATILVDGAPQSGPAPVTLKLTPGQHTLSISAPEYETKELSLAVKGGARVEQTVELVAKPAPPPPPPPVVAAPPPPPPPPPPARSKVPAYITLGIAGAGAVVGTIFGVKALSSKSDFDDKPTSDSADDTERNALIADMAFGVAITLGVTGIVLLTSDDPPPAAGKLEKLPAKAKLELAPYASPQGGGAMTRYTF